jgi:hypothetical protein
MDEERYAPDQPQATLAATAVGIEVGDLPPPSHLPKEQFPFTAGTKSAMVRTVKEAFRIKNQIEPKHLLLALLGSRQHDPVSELLTELGVDRDSVRRKLTAPS